MERKLFSAAVLWLGMVGLNAIAAEHVKESPAEVKKAVAEGKAVLIDVRELGEWKEGHLKDAKHLALSEIKRGVKVERLKTLMPAGKIVYLHCAAGGRCLTAAELLKKNGIKTRPLKNGFDDLVEAGFEKAK